METVTYTKKELAQLIESEFYHNLINIPISRLRAISQINNPRADDDDVLLVVQYDGNKTVGYLGVLPDTIYHENTVEKFGWLTCFWVADEYKGNNVAAILFLKVIRSWDQKIMITNFVPWLEQVYQKTKIFQPTYFKSGIRCYMRFNLAELLPPKKAIFHKLRIGLSVFDFAVNCMIDFRLFFYKKIRTTQLPKYEYLNTLDAQAIEFINQFDDNNWVKRSSCELDWILSNPWLVQGAKQDYQSIRYYFSLLKTQFYYQLVKFYDERGNISGLVLFNIKDKNITVPYIFAQPEAIKGIADFIIYTMLGLNLNMLTTFNDNLKAEIEHLKAPFIYKKGIQKPYLVSKKFEFINQLKFQDGDGDCVFY